MVARASRQPRIFVIAANYVSAEAWARRRRLDLVTNELVCVNSRYDISRTPGNGRAMYIDESAQRIRDLDGLVEFAIQRGYAIERGDQP